MKKNALALLSGAIFALGLGVSGMTRPAKVLDFLDVTGAWDASLAFVMMGAIGLNVVVYRLILRRAAPIFGGVFALPTRRDVDVRLLAGAGLFGVGWGLAGYCPGPGVVSLAAGQIGALVFVAMMIAGQVAHYLVERVGAAPDREGDQCGEPAPLPAGSAGSGSVK